MRPRVFDRRVLAFAALSVAGLTPIFLLVERLAGQPSHPGTTLVRIVGVAVVMLTGYELFFALQRTRHAQYARVIRAQLDERIPFYVNWVWVYGLLYYVLVCLPIAFLAADRQFFLFIAGGLTIFLISVPVFIYLPTRCPEEWRDHRAKGVSTKFLAFIQQFDNGRSCIPSLHSAFGAYAATFIPSGIALVLIPLLICLSCVFVKQHSVLDIPPGLFLGFAVGFAVKYLMQ